MKNKKKYYFEAIENNIVNQEPLSVEDFKNKAMENFLEYKKNFLLRVNKIKKSELLYQRADFLDTLNKHINYFNILENNIKNI